MEASESLSCENNNISLFSALPESFNVTDIILEPPVKFWNVDTQFG